MLKWLPRFRPTIEFYCAKENFGAIAKPVPANKVMPEWYRELQPVDPTVVAVTETALTVKRCMPFLEALSQGWILLTPVELRVQLSGDGQTISTYTDFPGKLITPHYGFQVRGSPMEQRAIIKFDTLWHIRTSPGWSCMLMPPLNRSSDIVPFAGVIDTDMYHQVVIPLYFNRPDGLFVVEKGTPLVQVVPFKRQTVKGVVRAATQDDIDGAIVQYRSVFTEKAWYRKNVWSRR